MYASQGLRDELCSLCPVDYRRENKIKNTSNFVEIAPSNIMNLRFLVWQPLDSQWWPVKSMSNDEIV